MDFEKKLVANFCCVKCRGKSAVTKTVPLSRNLPELLSLSSERFILLTCTLCGYTEMYSPVAFVPTEETVADGKRLAHET
jgi:predicted nucleic-acid-binding Zn-ribbon protein